MLLLSRHARESIMIGDDIEIQIMKIEGGQVQLGIAAPRHISVHRKEIYLALQAENAVSSTTDKNALDNAHKHVKRPPERKIKKAG